MAEPKRDPTNLGCGHPLRVHLSPVVIQVKTATPLRATPDGYVIAKPDEEPDCFAGNKGEGGHDVIAYRSMTVDTHESFSRVGDRVDLRDVDDYGNIFFKLDLEGPYNITGETTVTLDVIQWKIRKGIADALRNAQMPQVRSEALGEVSEVGDTNGSNTTYDSGSDRPVASSSVDGPVLVQPSPAGSSGDPTGSSGTGELT